MRVTHRSRILLAFVAGVALAACGEDDDMAMGREPPSIPEDDVAYVEELVPHHMGAIEMADEVLARGADPEVRAMASEMKTAQEDEIATMMSTRHAMTGRDAMPMMADPHMDADMAELRGLSGLELDRAFLRHMIPHHAGAVLTSHRALPNLTRPELRELAEMTVAVQTREAAAMLDRLEALGR